VEVEGLGLQRQELFRARPASARPAMQAPAVQAPQGQLQSS
jgi:2,4-didehydro-3-deoxy-L-rhamnonate hydrolase